MAAPSTTNSSPEQAEPAWESAHIFPSQGTWSEEEYLALKTKLKLENDHYVEHGQFGHGATAKSPLLAGLQIDVDAVFAIASL